MAKAPVTGIVTHVSKRGTEVHLMGDLKRYRGFRQRGLLVKPGNKTYPIFKNVRVGDYVRLTWGGFANLNIVRVEILPEASNG
jgi:hypothetical protein